MPSPTKEVQRGETLFPRHLGNNPRPACHNRLPGTAAHDGTAKPQAFGKLSHGQWTAALLPTGPSCLEVQFANLPVVL